MVGEMPRFNAASTLAVMATTCLIGSATPASRSQFMATSAFASGSVVVKDLEATITSVSCGSSRLMASATECESTFEAKRTSRRAPPWRSARVISLRPQSLPPMPRCSTLE